MPLRWFHLSEEDARFNEGAFVDQVLGAQSGRAPSSPRYSNLGYLALGVAVERAVGQPFRQALRDKLLVPLRLARDEHLGFTPQAIQEHAYGHLRRFGLLNLCLGWVVERERIVSGTAGRWLRSRDDILCRWATGSYTLYLGDVIMSGRSPA